MNNKLLELLQQIRQANESLKKDKINHLMDQADAPRSEPPMSSAPEYERNRPWPQTSSIQPNGLAAGGLFPPKLDAFSDAYMLEKEPKLDVEALNNSSEGIPQETSDERKLRYQKLFGK